MEKYKVISFEEGNQIRQSQRLKMKYQIPSNYAIIYEDINKQILLFPAKGDKVVLFPNEDVMMEVINEIGIPIPSNNIFVKNNHIIAEWEKNIEVLLNDLSILIKINLKNKIMLDQLFEISKAINKLIKGKSQDEIFETYHLTFGALLGKVVTDNYENAKWKLYIYYDVNPYHAPDVEINGHRLELFKPIFDDILRRKIRLDYCLKRLSIKTSQ